MSIKVSGNRPQVHQQPEIVCPVLRGMVNDGHLNMDENGDAKISELKGIFEDLGMSKAGAYVAVLGNRPRDILGNLFSGTFNLNDLRGGILDHSGDSMVLRNGQFDPERFEALISHSSDGKTMTETDFKKAIAANKEIDNASFLGSKISGVEFSILLNAFGKEDANGTMRLSIDDMRGLYQDKKVPDSFRPESKAAIDNQIAAMANEARGLSTQSTSALAKAGINSALRQDDLFNVGNLGVKSAGQGVCPHMGSAGEQTTPASNAEITQLHNQLQNATQLPSTGQVTE